MTLSSYEQQLEDNYSLDRLHGYNQLIHTLNCDRHIWNVLDSCIYNCSNIPHQVLATLNKEENITIVNKNELHINQRQKTLALCYSDPLARELEILNPDKEISIVVLRGDKNPILIVAVDKYIQYLTILSGPSFINFTYLFSDDEEEEEEEENES